MKEFVVVEDIGFQSAMRYQGQIPSPEDYDTVLDAEVINCDFKVLGPRDIFGDRPLLAAIKRHAFTDQDYTDIKTCLDSINITSDLRIAQAGPWDPKELLRQYNWVEGVDYKFKGGNKNAMIRRKKDGTWDTVARGRPIHSVLIGYKRGRFTGEIELDAWSKKNPDKLEILNRMNVIADATYQEIAPFEYAAQRAFADDNIPKTYHLGGTIFTTLSANKYEDDDTSMMGYHIDAGDLNTSLTCLSVFHIGTFTGALFVLPQFRVAISIGDGDVFVGDSRKQHGVSPIAGKGRRLSCVSYCDTRLANDPNLRYTED